MPKFRLCPLVEDLIDKYWEPDTGWVAVSRWAAEDLVNMEIFANSELQRRAHARQGRMYVRGNETRH